MQVDCRCCPEGGDRRGVQENAVLAEADIVGGAYGVADAAILPQIVARLLAELDADLLGVVAGGSRVRGQADANSDIDVVAIIGSPRRRRRNFVIDGIEIETFVNPLFQIRRYFVDERKNRRGIMPHLVGTGVILLDRHGILPELQEEARAVRALGPLPPSKFEIWQMRLLRITHSATRYRDLPGIFRWLPIVDGPFPLADPQRQLPLPARCGLVLIAERCRNDSRYLDAMS